MKVGHVSDASAGSGTRATDVHVGLVSLLEPILASAERKQVVLWLACDAMERQVTCAILRSSEINMTKNA